MDTALAQQTDGRENHMMIMLLKQMLRKSMDTWGKDTALKLQRRPSKVEPKTNKNRNGSTTPQQQETSLSTKTVVTKKSFK